MTQEALAERLGVELSTVGRWERGAQLPQPPMRLKLAAALSVSIDELAGLLGAGRTPPRTMFAAIS
ncbi:helix-turn-helix transcriptional regulator [Actinokineospora sp.]|uniref:helix-turn-helix transcriptional regulator n=1 Tax=Actinokineospora sp. TaxID=1872133 RepID=UPI003D6C6007